MAKKTVASVIRDLTPAAPKKNGKVVSDDLKIDELTLLRLTRSAEKVRAASMELQLASATMNGLFQKFLQENEDAKKMNGRIVELQSEIQKHQKVYGDLVADIGKRLKVDMKEYAYDDETGVLSKIPPPDKAELAAHQSKPE